MTTAGASASYAATAVLFWIGVVVVTIGGCWLLDKISEALAGRRERRRPYITRPEHIPHPRAGR